MIIHWEVHILSVFAKTFSASRVKRISQHRIVYYYRGTYLRICHYDDALREDLLHIVIHVLLCHSYAQIDSAQQPAVYTHALYICAHYAPNSSVFFFLVVIVVDDHRDARPSSRRPLRRA